MPARTFSPGLLITFGVLVTSSLAYGCGSDAPTDPGTTPPPASTAPAAPSGLTAAAIGNNAVSVAWQDNSGDESGFRVERSPDGTGSWTQVATAGVDAEAYDDTGLSEGTQYFYRVAAVGTGGVSGYTNVADATTMLATRATEAVVADIASAIEDVLPPAGTALVNRNFLEEVRAAAAAIRTLDGVDTVLVLEEELSVQSVMEDGIVHLFIHNRPLGADTVAVPLLTSAPTLASSSTGGPLTDPVRAAGDGPPKSARAVVTSFDGGDVEAGRVASQLSAAGYNVLGLGASLADMRQYTDLGVLYLDTHGVAYRTVTGGEVLDGTSFALQTSTTLGDDLSAIREELVTGQLAVSSKENDAGGLTTTIAVTGLFMAQNWSFDEGVVVIHACYVGAASFTVKDVGELNPAELRLAILGAGARVVVGFDNLTWASFAEPSFRFFFDRLLGANEEQPVSPPLRPFDMDQVYTDMQDRGLLSFDRPEWTFLGLGIGGNEVNVTFDRLAGRTTLAPSIQYMDVVDDVAQSDGELTLRGLFGDEQGTVEVAGVPVSVQSWSAETIVARAPFQADGSAGSVVVKKPTGVESNEAPLTEWRGTITLTSESLGDLTGTANLDVRFRADVHASRATLTADPAHRAVRTYFSPASTGTVSGSGSRTEGDVTTTWFGSYPMPVLARTFIDNGVFPLTSPAMGGDVRLDPDARQAEICIAAWGQVGMRIDSPAGSEETTTAVPLIAPDLGDSERGLLGCVTATLDGSSFVISGGTRSLNPAQGAQLTLTWTDFTPFSPPTDQTPG